ncbi:MAG: hypothetical protein JWN62_3508 [Acidimicrobiales bacterium]|nr:hypothetical protein [Acidimicrobiales bacterium]
MNTARHVHEIYIKSAPEAVWRALTDPAFTVKYFHGTAIESSFVKGEGYRYVMEGGTDAIEGVIEEVEPGVRLVMTFRFLYDAALAAEPPSRVEWVLTPAGDVTKLTLRHGDLFKSPLTWETVRTGWLVVIDGLKTLLETGEPLGDVQDPDAFPTDANPEGEWHRAQGIAANNGTWDWLGKPDGERTADDEEQMTLSAYAAAYHWTRAARSGPANVARANWLLSRVWAVRANGPLALHHADIVLATCLEHSLVDFDLAYAHEARARALACLGRYDEAAAERAEAAAVPIVDDEDRSIFDPDLAAGPWFGLPPVAV